MTPRELKQLQKEKLENQKLQPHKKISNNFIDATIKNNTVGALKTIYYISALIEKIEQLETIGDLNLLKLDIDTRDMLKFTELSLPDIKRNLKSMQETSITFVNQELQEEEGINLLPYYKFIYGKNRIEIQIFKKIANLIVEVKQNYTMIDTKALMRLKSKHTLKMLPLLMKINNYSPNVGKRKTMDLDDFNAFFGTSYKRLQDIERFILKPVQEELNLNSKLSFIYELNFIQIDLGRPKAHNITIDLKDNSGSLFAI
jgi:plasmid replication initiation protein